MLRRILLLTVLFSIAHQGLRAAASDPPFVFNYQGSLKQDGAPANGSFDFEVHVYDAPTDGMQLAAEVLGAIAVSEGIFDFDLALPVFLLDQDLYLEILVRPAGVGMYAVLTPRQAVKAAPFAYRAFSVDANSITGFNIVNGSIANAHIGSSAIDSAKILDGSIGSADIAVNAVNGNHIAASSVGASEIEGGSIDGSHIADSSIGNADVNSNTVQWRVVGTCSAGSAIREISSGGGVTCEPVVATGGWSLTGNAGTTAGTHFLGTTDDVALQLHVNNQRTWRSEWLTSAGPSGPAITGGHPNNKIGSTAVGSVISGGGVLAAPNEILSGQTSTIGGGLGHTINAGNATIGGGSSHSVTGTAGTIGGGTSNSVGGDNATVPGGQSNVADGERSFAAGHQAQALHANTFVFNDGGGAFASTAASQFLIDVADGVGIGVNSPSDFLHLNAPAGRNALRVQIDGATRLRVYDHGGVSVGVNTSSTPAEGLLVQGDILARGAITLDNAATRWKTFAASEFVPTESSTDYRSDGGHLRATNVIGTNDEEFAVGLHLPHGAVVNQLRVVVLDNDNFQDIKVRIRRRGIFGNLDTVAMAEVSTSTANASLQELTDSTINSATIDNENYSYVVEVDTGESSTGDIRLYNVRVRYTVTTLLP